VWWCGWVVGWTVCACGYGGEVVSLVSSQQATFLIRRCIFLDAACVVRLLEFQSLYIHSIIINLRSNIYTTITAEQKDMTRV